MGRVVSTLWEIPEHMLPEWRATGVLFVVDLDRPLHAKTLSWAIVMSLRLIGYK